MSEREIRETVRAVMAELDRRARGVGRGVRKAIIPAAMGTALALSGCDSGREVTTQDGRADVQVPGVDAAYLAPDVAVYMGPDLGADLAPGADAAYMGPDAGVDPELGLLYMAPGPDAAETIDVGVAPLYMAPPEEPSFGER